METKQIDKNNTIQVENKELEARMELYAGEATVENLTALIRCLSKSRILVPAVRGEEPGKTHPCLLQAGNGKTIFPVFTSFGQTARAPKSEGILNMPFEAVVETVLGAKDAIAGIAVNPFSQNLVLKKELVSEIKKREYDAQKEQKVQMTEAEYEIWERMRFEKGFLPKKFFAEGKKFLLDLDERREAYLDVLFEESYEQKRRYPYLEEDFSVMVMSVTEELLVARVEFPGTNLGPGVALRGFLVWNDRLQQAGYFTIDKGAKGNVFAQVTKDGRVSAIGEAPTEGTELQRVVDLMCTPQTDEMTS